MEIRTRKGKDSKIPLLSILIVSLVALSIGYSALSSTLKINGVASVSSMSWRVEFQNLNEAVLTGNAQKVSDPVISKDKTELKSYNVNFSDPGDSITYTFQIANNGTIDAKLSEIVKENISCEGYGSDEQAAKDATNVCANLEYSLKYNEEEEHFDNKGSTINFSNNTEVNDLLKAGEVKDMVLTLKYKSPVDGETIEEPKDDVSISGLGITLTYSQIKTPTIAEKNPSTPLPSVSFAEDSWDTIIRNVKSGHTSSYHVGDTKEISLKNYGTHTVRIANMSTPDECNSEVFSQSACGFVVEFADIITKHHMNPSGDYNGTNYANGWNMGGWPESAMYKFVNDESDENSIINSLPTILRESIGNTYTLSGHGVNDGYDFESNDKLYFLSSSEVWAEGTSSIITTDSAKDYTRQLDYYKNMGVTTNSNLSSAIKSFEGTDTWWWLRTANSNYHSAFFTVNATGGHIGNNASLNMGVSPAFRILEDKKEESSTDPEISQFASDSWKTIADNVKNGNTNNYHVGDTKTMKIDNSDYTFRIVNMSTPDICNTKNFSQSACGFVVEMSNSEFASVMNGTDTVEGGWGKSGLRNILDCEAYYLFPFSLYAAQTDIFSYKNRNTNEYYTSSDYFYIPSTVELYSTDVTGMTEENWNQFDDYGLTRQLDYYAEAKKNGTLDEVLRRAYNNNDNFPYWTRSIVNNQSFNYIGDATTTVDSTSELGLSVLFKLPGPNKSNTKPEGSSFEKDSWETIATNIKNGNTSNYHVGDTKKVTLKTLGTKTLKIVNMSSPYVCNDENYSQTACGFVVEFDDIVINKPAFSVSAVSDEWSSSVIRDYLNDDFLSEVPGDLLNVVSNTRTVSYGLDSSKTLYKSNDKFYIKSYGEIQNLNYLVFGDDGFSEDNRITHVLDYYRPTQFYPTDITKMVKKYNATNNAKYWFRTTSLYNKKNNMVYFDKSFNTTADGSIEAGVVPAFRITGNTVSESGSESGTFAGDSWETIAKNVKNKTTSNYHVGDTKTINFGDSGGATFRIVNMSTPDICKTENFSQSACGFVVEFVNLFTKEKMNNTDTVEGGWPETYLRMLLNEALLIEYKNVLPSALVNAINNTKIVSYQNRDANSYYITSDKFYIPSTIELYSTDVTGMSEETWKQYDDYGLTRQLDYYADAKNNGTLDDALKKTYSSTEFPYWTRSIINNSRFGTVGVVPSGSNNTSTLGVNLLFRLKGSNEDDPVGSGTFYDDSWETIANNIKTGNTGNYHIGDTKEVTLKTLGKKTLKIVNMSTPDECNNTNYSQSACGFVVEFDDIVTNKSLSDTTAVSNKWSNTKVSEYLNNEFLNEVPEDLLNVVAPTKVISFYNRNAKTYTTSVDKFYVKAYGEIIDLDPSGISQDYTITEDLSLTHTLDYYKPVAGASDADQARYFYKSFNGVNGAIYWVRSILGNDNVFANYIVNSGDMSISDDASAELGVVPMFRITGDTSEEVSSFETDSWETIKNNIKNGNTSNYRVGDTKEVTLKTLGKKTLKIVNMSTPDECNNTNYSQSACGFVVEFDDVVTSMDISDNDTMSGGWPATKIREYLNNEFLNEVPEDLLNVVSSTKVLGYNDYHTKTYYNSIDKFYIKGYVEVVKDGITSEAQSSSSNGVSYSEDNDITRGLDYYNLFTISSSSSSKNYQLIKTYNGSSANYLLKTSLNVNNLNAFFYVKGNVLANTETGLTELGVVPMFRITGNENEEIGSFETDSWETIATNIKNGNTSDYKVGDTKEVTLKTLGTKTLRIVNMSSPNVCNDSNFSQTGCGFVFEFTDIINKKTNAY